MKECRITEHPIRSLPAAREISFAWNGERVVAREDETIASALFANGIRTFGHHFKDGAPMGIFCANGQCAQCSVVADGVMVKSCMARVREGMEVASLEGHAALPDVPSNGAARFTEIELIDTECLIIGGGPAGLSAAVELGRAGVNVILVDDKSELGGKLVLQTHKFFGSIDACRAGTRGIDIGKHLEAAVRTFENVKIMTEANAISVFADRKIGVVRKGRYSLIRPQALLVATGARERSLVFKGNTLPGVYGAGAFQTLVNRDLVRPAERIFIVGGGNVGLIAGYHALQAGIEVAGLCEALPECGGYKVHKDKLVRMGVPIYTGHTIISANGASEVESVTIGQLDSSFRVVPGTEKSFACDTLLVAVGLEPVDEFLKKAQAFGLPVFAAGDAEEIAEASAAMFAGKIRGLEIAKSLGRDVAEVPDEWRINAKILKSRPGAVVTEEIPEEEGGVFPVFHCSQEIPCNPCTSVCPRKAITIDAGDILGLPNFDMDSKCDACEKCVSICPGLAITLVDYRKPTDEGEALVTIAYEFSRSSINVGDELVVLDTLGEELGAVKVERVRSPLYADRAALVRVRTDRTLAKKIAGIRVQESSVTRPLERVELKVSDDEIVCRCERVTAGELRRHIRAGVRDLNELKALTRCGMGACGGKTCPSLVMRLFREEGVAPSAVTELTQRPVFMEVPLGVFAGIAGDEAPEADAPRTAPGALQGGL